MSDPVLLSLQVDDPVLLLDLMEREKLEAAIPRADVPQVIVALGGLAAAAKLVDSVARAVVAYMTAKRLAEGRDSRSPAKPIVLSYKGDHLTIEVEGTDHERVVAKVRQLLPDDSES